MVALGLVFLAVILPFLFLSYGMAGAAPGDGRTPEPQVMIYYSSG